MAELEALNDGSLNRKYFYGQNALHIYAMDNNLPEMQRLLSLGVDVDVRDDNNQTPLHLAANRNRGDSHYAAIELLLKSGADVNARNGQGTTPLKFLVGQGCGVATARLLLSFNADVNIKSDHGGIALFGATYGNLEVFQLLVNHGSEINWADTDGKTALHLACMVNKLGIIKFLLKKGANFNAVDCDGRTPLMWMLRILDNKNLEKKLAILMKYVDINKIDSNGNNILCYTNKENHWKIILEYIAKLQALNIPVHSDIINKISTSRDLNDYFSICTDELADAKNTKICNSWVTFLNLLLDNKKKLKNYAGNKDLVNNFKSRYCQNNFNIYGESILKNYNKGVKIRKMFDKSSWILSNILPIFSPTHLIIRNVLDTLTLKDYQLFNSKI